MGREGERINKPSVRRTHFQSAAPISTQKNGLNTPGDAAAVVQQNRSLQVDQNHMKAYKIPKRCFFCFFMFFNVRALKNSCLDEPSICSEFLKKFKQQVYIISSNTNTFSISSEPQEQLLWFPWRWLNFGIGSKDSLVRWCKLLRRQDMRIYKLCYKNLHHSQL